MTIQVIFGMLDSNGNFFIDVGSNGDDVIIRQNGETNIGLQGKVLVGLTTALNTANKLHVNNAIALGSSLYTFNQVIGNGANLELVSNANPANIGTNSNIIFKLGTSGGGGPNEAMRIVSTGNVGISTTTPKTLLHVGDSSKGNYLGNKTFTLSNTFADALTIELPDHTACYVKIFVNGDWSNHSSVVFLGEYFIQNGADSFNEPGLIISETDNTYNGSVSSQIVDSSTDTFIIQLKLMTQDRLQHN